MSIIIGSLGITVTINAGITVGSSGLTISTVSSAAVVGSTAGQPVGLLLIITKAA